MSVLELFRLDGRTALVTGGGRGLGEHMALGLAQAGANVVLCSRKREACEEVAGRIESGGGRALPLACDVADPDDVERVVSAARDAFGGIDVLVNNSGATWGAPPEEMPLEKFDQVMQVNVRGVFLMAQAVARTMIARGGGGSIVNVSSVAAFKGGRPGALQASGYAASKGAVVSLTRDLAGSWAHHGIRVNCIAPGWFPTRMSRGVLEKAGELLLSTIPLGRYGEPEDIQGAVLFLASRASAYMTGQTILVDGGQTVW
ncbi:MAG TPA: SDR family oxidoreductase [Longimicrobiaceae bacterium]|nr:SDR family oxidoreductase [Longimicrobiaceae bacterium]